MIFKIPPSYYHKIILPPYNVILDWDHEFQPLRFKKKKLQNKMKYGFLSVFLTMFVGGEIARKFSIESFTNDFRIIKERRAQKHKYVSKS